MHALATLLPYAAILLLVVCEAGCALFLMLIIAFTTGFGSAGWAIMLSAGLSLLANGILSGHALWIGARGWTTLGLIAGHILAVLIIGIGFSFVSGEPAPGSPRMRERSWIWGFPALAWVLLIMLAYVAIDWSCLRPFAGAPQP